MSTWYKPANKSKHKEMVRRFVETSCLECLIDISGWRDEEHPDWSFMSIGMLSNHVTSWRESWRGRIHIAWRALRGRLSHEIDFNSRQEANEFIARVAEVVDATWPPAYPEDITLQEVA